MKIGTVYGRLSAELDDYLEDLGMRVEKGPLRAMGELVRGILLTGSVQLTNAARLLASTSAGLAEAVNRLDHHLSNPRWDHRDWVEGLRRWLIAPVTDDELIPIDATELAKPYARKMQYTCTVRDASRPGDPLVTGYWCWGAYRWRPDVAGGTLAALSLRPYSTRQPGFRSENDTWGRLAWELHQAMGDRGIWLSDRGADRPEVLSVWLRLRPRWIIRLREDRRLIGPDGTVRPAGVWADWGLQQRPPRGRAVTVPVRLPARDVPQTGPPAPLWLVVPTYTFGNDERWVLLTRGLIDHHTGPRQVRYDYAARWRSEDAKRFLGQVWHVERFLTRDFLALERLLWCVVAASGFVARLQEDQPQLIQALQAPIVYWKKPVKVPCYRWSQGLLTAVRREGPATLAVNA